MKFQRTYTWYANGEKVTVELDIDLEAVAVELAARASNNTTGKAGMMGGLMKAKVIARTGAKNER